MKLTSKAIPSSEEFRQNRAAHLEALETIREAAHAARLGGGEKARRRGATQPLRRPPKPADHRVDDRQEATEACFSAIRKNLAARPRSGMWGRW